GITCSRKLISLPQERCLVSTDSENESDCLMRIFACKEQLTGERRAPVTPASVAKLIRLGAKVKVEEGIGASISCSDADYEKAGAEIGRDRERSLREADLVLRVRKPTSDEAGLLKAGCIQISFLDPFNERQL